MKKVYVISPFAGDVEGNVKKAARHCRKIVELGHMPVAAHLLYPQFLNDNDPAERAKGLAFGLALLDSCDEAWVFGKIISSGMEGEIKRAKEIGVPVKYVSGKEKGGSRVTDNGDR